MLVLIEQKLKMAFSTAMIIEAEGFDVSVNGKLVDLGKGFAGDGI